MLTENLTERSLEEPFLLNNVTCPYCGIELPTGTDTKEHVVGRRFVPKGTLAKKWNLIIRACSPCNSKKADLEDEISAVTMQPDVFGNYPSANPALISDAKRKAQGARSRTSGKPINESSRDETLEIPFSGGIAKITFTGPPQVDSKRVYALARMHIMAFFYFVTYREDTKTGRFWRGEFMVLDEARRADWGNQQFREFMNAVVGWEPRFLAYDPEHFFNIVIRKHPATDCWSWAMEWNQNFRVMGFCGDKAAAFEVYSKFSSSKTADADSLRGHHLRIRFDTPLKEDEDNLFVWCEPTESAQ